MTVRDILKILYVKHGQTQHLWVALSAATRHFLMDSIRPPWKKKPYFSGKIYKRGTCGTYFSFHMCVKRKYVMRIFYAPIGMNSKLCAANVAP